MYKLNTQKFKKRDSKEDLLDPKDDFSKYALGLEEWRRNALQVILFNSRIHFEEGREIRSFNKDNVH